MSLGRRRGRRPHGAFRDVPTALVAAMALLGCGGRLAPGATGSPAEEDATAGETASPPATTPDAGTGPAAPEAGAGDAVDAGDAPGPECPASVPSGSCNTNEQVCDYPGYDCTCTSGCSPGQCCPMTCAQLGFPCGAAGDGCGGELHCRKCPPGQACGANGACGPSDSCVPSCPARACGEVEDTCGGKIDCGGCYWTCRSPGR